MDKDKFLPLPTEVVSTPDLFTYQVEPVVIKDCYMMLPEEKAHKIFLEFESFTATLSAIAKKSSEFELIQQKIYENLDELDVLKERILGYLDLCRGCLVEIHHTSNAGQEMAQATAALRAQQKEELTKHQKELEAWENSDDPKLKSRARIERLAKLAGKSDANAKLLAKELSERLSDVDNPEPKATLNRLGSILPPSERQKYISEIYSCVEPLKEALIQNPTLNTTAQNLSNSIGVESPEIAIELVLRSFTYSLNAAITTKLIDDDHKMVSNNTPPYSPSNVVTDAVVDQPQKAAEALSSEAGIPIQEAQKIIASAIQIANPTISIPLSEKPLDDIVSYAEVLRSEDFPTPQKAVEALTKHLKETTTLTPQEIETKSQQIVNTLVENNLTPSKKLTNAQIIPILITTYTVPVTSIQPVDVLIPKEQIQNIILQSKSSEEAVLQISKVLEKHKFLTADDSHSSAQQIVEHVKSEISKGSDLPKAISTLITTHTIPATSIQTIDSLIPQTQIQNIILQSKSSEEAVLQISKVLENNKLFTPNDSLNSAKQIVDHIKTEVSKGVDLPKAISTLTVSKQTTVSISKSQAVNTSNIVASALTSSLGLTPTPQEFKNISEILLTTKDPKEAATQIQIQLEAIIIQSGSKISLPKDAGQSLVSSFVSSIQNLPTSTDGLPPSKVALITNSVNIVNDTLKLNLNPQQIAQIQESILTSKTEQEIKIKITQIVANPAHVNSFIEAALKSQEPLVQVQKTDIITALNLIQKSSPTELPQKIREVLDQKITPQSAVSTTLSAYLKVPKEISDLVSADLKNFSQLQSLMSSSITKDDKKALLIDYLHSSLDNIVTNDPSKATIVNLAKNHLVSLQKDPKRLDALQKVLDHFQKTTTPTLPTKLDTVITLLSKDPKDLNPKTTQTLKQILLENPNLHRQILVNLTGSENFANLVVPLFSMAKEAHTVDDATTPTKERDLRYHFDRFVNLARDYATGNKDLASDIKSITKALADPEKRTALFNYLNTFTPERIIDIPLYFKNLAQNQPVLNFVNSFIKNPETALNTAKESLLNFFSSNAGKNVKEFLEKNTPVGQIIKVKNFFESLGQLKNFSQGLEMAIKNTGSYKYFANTIKPIYDKIAAPILKAAWTRFAASSLGKAAISVAAKIGLSGAFKALTTAIGNVIPIPVVGAIIGFVAGFVAEKIIGKLWPQIKKLLKNLIILAAGFGFLAGYLLAGLPAAIFGMVAAAGTTALVSAALGLQGGAAAVSGIATVGAAITSILAATIASILGIVMVIILSIPITLALILFIINNSAFVLPPSLYTFSGASGEPFPGAGSTINCTPDYLPLSFANTATNPIAKRNHQLINGLKRGFWCYWNQQPDYPQYFDYPAFVANPNPPVGGQNLFWCTIAVYTAYNEAGNPIPHTYITDRDMFRSDIMRSWFINQSRYVSSEDALRLGVTEYVKPGDVIFVNTGSDGRPVQHVAMVWAATKDFVQSIDSNASDKTFTYSISQGKMCWGTNCKMRIVGFGKQSKVTLPGPR